MKTIVLAGSKGIGKEICSQLKDISSELICTGRKQVDTSNLNSVKEFIKKHSSADVLVLNTGGPEPLNFKEITEEVWLKYFNQLFLSFVLILQHIEIKQNGYVFLISSYYIKEPNPKLILSNSFRIAFVSVFKTLSKIYMEKNISFINIAPGPTKTDRLMELVLKDGKTMEEFIGSLATKRISDPSEIGKFIRFVVENKIKAMNGVTINFDMGLSNYIL